MKTDFEFIAEKLESLESALTAELPSIIASISTEEVPLTMPTIYSGFFDPMTYSTTPAVFINPDEVGKSDEEDETYSSFDAYQKATMSIVCSAEDSDMKKFSFQLFNYVKALIVFLNTHQNRYEYLSDSITFWDQLGADTSKRWAEVPIRIEMTITY